MVQVVKNHKIKPFFAAAAAAGRAAQFAKMTEEEMGESVLEAAKTYGGWDAVAQQCKILALADEAIVSPKDLENFGKSS